MATVSSVLLLSTTITSHEPAKSWWCEDFRDDSSIRLRCSVRWVREFLDIGYTRFGERQYAY